MDTPTPRLTLAQEEAVLYDGSAALLAGAGSGKTLVLTEKIVHLVGEKKIPLDRLLVVTFTDKAAEEIRRRLARRLRRTEKDMPEGSIGTVHAFAASLLHLRGQKLGLSQDFTLMEESLAHLDRLRTVRQEILTLVNLRDPTILDTVDRYGFHGTIRLFLDLMNLSCRHQIAPSPHVVIVDHLRKIFFQKKRSQNLLDFNDLEALTLELLNRPEEKDRLQNNFQWIIVDEFQDINPVQWKILSQIHQPDKNNLVIVGDPRQSIYRFRGADPTLFEKVRSDIERSGGRTLFLSENFRSARSIIHCVNAVAGKMFEEDFPPLKNTRTAEGSTDILLFDPGVDSDSRRAAEAITILQKLENLYREGHAWGKMVLLFKNKNAVPYYECLLHQRQIPFVTTVSETLLERPEVICILLFLEQLALKNHPETDPQRRLALAGLEYSPLKDFPSNFSTESLVFFLESFFEPVLLRFPDLWHQMNLKAFKKLLEGLLQLGETSLSSLVAAVRVLREENAQIPCAQIPPRTGQVSMLSLMTIHKSKGLEFPIVVLCDIEGRSGQTSRRYLYDASTSELLLKDKDRETRGLKERAQKSDRFEELEALEKRADKEESKRLLYVALTRAEEHLILPLPYEKTDRKRRDDWSGWLR